jgi:hypothetical protein
MADETPPTRSHDGRVHVQALTPVISVHGDRLPPPSPPSDKLVHVRATTPVISAQGAAPHEIAATRAFVTDRTGRTDFLTSIEAWAIPREVRRAARQDWRRFKWREAKRRMRARQRDPVVEDAKIKRAADVAQQRVEQAVARAVARAARVAARAAARIAREIARARAREQRVERHREQSRESMRRFRARMSWGAVEQHRTLAREGMRRLRARRGSQG